MLSQNEELRAGRQRLWRFAFALAAGVFIFQVIVPMQRLMTGQNDFVHWYVGGLLFGTPDIHDQNANQVLQRELIGAVFRDSYFIRPTFYGLLLKPLTLFPYMTAYVLFQAFSLACFATFVAVYQRKWGQLLLFSAMSVPLISTISNGQDVTLLLLFCTLSLFLAGKRRDFLSGLALSLCAIKFHLFILTPFAMASQKRWKIIAGAAAGEVILFLLGFTGGGWPAFMGLVALLKNPKNHPYPGVMPNIRGFLASFGSDSTVLLAVLSAAVLICALYLIFRAPTYEKSLAYALMGGLLLNYHSFSQDAILLLLTSALLLDGAESTAFRRVSQAMLLPVSYLLLLLGPPVSGLFAFLLMLALGVAVRDQFGSPAFAGDSTAPAGAA